MGSAIYEFYQQQPVLTQRLISFVAILAGLAACVAFLRLISLLFDQALPPRDLPPSWSLDNLESVDPEQARRVLDSINSIGQQPTRVLPHRRSIEVEIR